MSIPDGFKVSEVGVIPVDWEIDSITRYCQDIFLGLTAKVDYVNHRGVPLIRATDISNGKLSFKNVLFISNKQHKQLTKYRKAKLGDVLVSKSGSLGVCALVDTETEFSIYESIIVLQPLINKLYPSFLLYLLTFQDTQKRLLGDTVGSTVGHLNLNSFKKLQIPLPPLAEQKAIAQSLSDVDNLITAIDKLITKKRNIKQGTMQELLTGKKRLPGFTGEWEVKKLGDVAPLQRGFDLPTSQLFKGSYPVVYSNGILNFHIKYKAKAPGVVTGRSGTIGKVTFVEEDYWPHNTTLWVTDFKYNDSKFIYYLYIFIGLEKFGTGSGVPTLNRNDVHIFQVPLPLLPEQKAIAEILTDIDKEIEALEKKRDKYKAIKQGMMQELLTGKTRIIDN